MNIERLEAFFTGRMFGFCLLLAAFLIVGCQEKECIQTTTIPVGSVLVTCAAIEEGGACTEATKDKRCNQTRTRCRCRTAQTGTDRGCACRPQT